MNYKTINYSLTVAVDSQEAIDNYIEVLKDEAYEDIESGYAEQGKAKLQEAQNIQSLRNAIESANIHGFLNDWSEEAFLEEFAK